MNPTKATILHRLFYQSHISLDELFVLLQDEDGRYAIPLSTLEAKPAHVTNLYSLLKTRKPHLSQYFTEGQLKEVLGAVVETLRIQ